MIDALKLNVINYKALAENIYEDVKVLLQKKDSGLISLDSIQSALIRYAEDLKEEKALLEEKISRIIAKTLTIRVDKVGHFAQAGR